MRLGSYARAPSIMSPIPPMHYIVKLGCVLDSANQQALIHFLGVGYDPRAVILDVNGPELSVRRATGLGA